MRPIKISRIIGNQTPSECIRTTSEHMISSTKKLKKLCHSYWIWSPPLKMILKDNCMLYQVSVAAKWMHQNSESKCMIISIDLSTPKMHVFNH